MMIRVVAAARPKAMRPSLPKRMRKFLCPDRHSNRTTLAAQERPQIVFSRLLFAILNLWTQMVAVRRESGASTRDIFSTSIRCQYTTKSEVVETKSRKRSAATRGAQEFPNVPATSRRAVRAFDQFRPGRLQFRAPRIIFPVVPITDGVVERAGKTGPSRNVRVNTVNSRVIARSTCGVRACGRQCDRGRDTAHAVPPARTRTGAY